MIPAISIKVDVEPHEFLDRLEDIAKQFDYISLIKPINTAGFDDWKSLNLEMQCSQAQKNVAGVIYSMPDNKDRVFIELRVDRCRSEPSTNDTYVEEAQLLFGPLIKVYNAQYASRRRLLIQANKSMTFVLSKGTTRLLKSFIGCANTSALHPLDWQRFYRLVAFCHAHRVKLSNGQLRGLLAKGGFSEERAEYLADIYSHGRKMLETIR